MNRSEFSSGLFLLGKIVRYDVIERQIIERQENLRDFADGMLLSENFNYPYISSSVTEFWRRWHISLSSWFKDYVYIPLGGNRCNKGRWLLNLFTVWTLTGIWHGANWTFLCWGLWYFIWLVFEKLTGITNKMGVFSHVYTILVIIIGWVIFRSNSMEEAVLYVKAMGGISENVLVDSIFCNYLKWRSEVLLY